MRRGFSAADLHVHTTASDGTAGPLEVLEWASCMTRLSVIAICDHNTNEGALEAAAAAHRFRIEVIVGQEVESAEGHVLGLFTPKRVRPGLSAERTVAAIHNQGGIAIAAHPFAPRWWHKHGLCRGERWVYEQVPFDGIEVANSTPLLLFANFRARAFWRAHRHRLAQVGGSDAHMLSVIGTSRTIFPGTSAEDLRRAILSRATRGWGPSFHPLRALRYARKVPEIRMRDSERRRREAELDVEGATGPCASRPDPHERER